jgi:hypothetical protein
MSTNPAAQVAVLPDLRISELKQLWRDLYGKEPPPYNRPYLMKRLAYRIQELAQGGLSEGARFQMKAVLQQIGADELAAPRRDAVHRRRRQVKSPVQGTRLVRDWQGERHEVTVLADGFEYAGRPYRSLSAIARAITGTQWNGPAFFGLRRGTR